ncbi:hypothetical protein Pcinc_007326 [Petrolisthes cinctipes]|uniref:Uncharacterized protein n=1 Tax=Petrolisthes cinctipes TaxID=88211 RepID=A0AAE1G9J7_PETCI|nr:hypothetical protein Pcinc_007326 [Petrolisthes cinctipes]
MVSEHDANDCSVDKMFTWNLQSGRYATGHDGHDTGTNYTSTDGANFVCCEHSKSGGDKGVSLVEDTDTGKASIIAVNKRVRVLWQRPT